MKEWTDRNKVIYLPEALYDKLMETKMLYNRQSGISAVSIGSIVALLLHNDPLARKIFDKLYE